MQYTVTINTVEVDVYNISITETIDQTLDFGFMEIRNSRKPSYNVGDYVRIIADFGDYKYYNNPGKLNEQPVVTTKPYTKTYDFIIESDVVMQMNETTYKHRINLIELTKRLENYTDTRRKFTQPSDPSQKKTLYDVAEILRQTIPFDLYDTAEASRLFDFSQNVIDRLSAIEAPEFQFENRNLREMLNDVFEIANGIPRLKLENIAGDKFILDGDFYNNLKDKIVDWDGEQFANQKQININESASALDSETANQLGELMVEPSPDENQFKTLVSPTGLLDTDSAVMTTEFAIADLRKVQIRALWTSLDGTREERALDISRYILERQEYDILPTNESLFNNRFEGDEVFLTKSNTTYYTRYQKNIGNLYQPYGFFVFSIENLERLVRDAIIEYEYNTNAGLGQTLANVSSLLSGTQQNMALDEDYIDFKNLQYRIEYIPYYTSRQLSRKLGIDKTSREMSRYYGQSDKITSPKRAIKKLFKTVQQMGNDQVQTSTRNVSYELGDYTEDGFVLITKETFFNTMNATAKYLWSKNYQQISQYIGMNAEPRVFEIPLEAFKRNFVWENYVELSEENKFNDSMFDDTLVNLFMKTMLNTSINSDKVQVATFYNPYLKDQYQSVDIFQDVGDVNASIRLPVNPELVRILKPLASSGSGNLINFYFEFDNPKSAGARQDRVGSKTLMELVPYTDVNGELEQYSYQLITGYSETQSKNFPIVEKSKTSPFFNLYERRFQAYLDSAEVLAQTTQLHIVPEAGSESKFIIGGYLSEHNGLWNPEFGISDRFKIVARDKPFNWSEETVTEGGTVDVGYSIVGNRFRLNSGILQASWALVRKSTNQLVFAVNQDDVTIKDVYFNFRNNRTGFVYEADRPQYSATEILPLPFGLFTLPLSETSIYVAWQYYDDVPFDEFVVEYAIEGTQNFTEIPQTDSLYYHTFTGLSPGTRYEFRVRAVQGDKTSLYAIAYGSTNEGAPVAPSNLTGEAIGQTRILLNWQDNSDNEYAFMVEASENSDMSDIFEFQSEPAGITSSIIQFLESNTTYYFRVKAIGNGGNSAYSNIVSVTTLAPEVVSTPTITGLSASTNAVTFTVTNTYDQLVTIKANLAINPPSAVITTNLVPNGTYTHTISGLAQGTGYTLYVRAESSGFTPSSVAQASFTTQSTVTAPPAPSFINESNLTDTSVRVTWEYVEQADGYTVALYRTSDNQIFDGEFDKGTLVVLHDYNNLTPGTQYRAEVRSFNESNNVRAYSSITSVTFTTTVTVPYPAAPSNVQITRAGTNNTITWQDNSNNEDGFVVSYAFQGQFDPVPGDEDYFPIHDTGAPNVTSYVHATFPGQGTYYYRVISYNSNGNSITYAQASLFVQQ